MAAPWTKQTVRLLKWTKRIKFSSPLSTSAFHRQENVQTSKETVVSGLMEKTKKKKEAKPSKVINPLDYHDYFEVRTMVSMEKLFQNRVHLGHHMGCRNPYMSPFIFGTRFNYDIIDLEQTLPLLQDALNFVAHVAYRDGIILFISKNRIIMPMVEQVAKKVGEYAHCRHWRDGLFTDSKNLFNDITRLPDLCIFLNTLDNVFETHPAVIESAKLLIPTVGIVDSNCDPRLISYAIPGNDDTVKTQALYLDLFREAILAGKEKSREDATKNK